MHDVQGFQTARQMPQLEMLGAVVGNGMLLRTLCSDRIESATRQVRQIKHSYCISARYTDCEEDVDQQDTISQSESG